MTVFMRTWDSEILKFRSLIFKADDHCANLFQRSRLCSASLTIPPQPCSCPAGDELALQQCPLLAFLSPHSPAATKQSTSLLSHLPLANNKPAEVLFVISVPCQLLRMQWGVLSSRLLLTFAAPAQTPQCFLQQTNVYKSIPRLFLSHRNHPEIAIGFIYSLSLYKHGHGVALKGWCCSSLSVSLL